MIVRRVNRLDLNNKNLQCLNIAIYRMQMRAFFAQVLFFGRTRPTNKLLIRRMLGSVVRVNVGQKRVFRNTAPLPFFPHLEEQLAVTKTSFIEQNRKQKTDADIWETELQ